MRRAHWQGLFVEKPNGHLNSQNQGDLLLRLTKQDEQQALEDRRYGSFIRNLREGLYFLVSHITRDRKERMVNSTDRYAQIVARKGLGRQKQEYTLTSRG